MNTRKICSSCQKPLTPNTPDGLCPACLMKAGVGTGVDIGPDSQDESRRTSFVHRDIKPENILLDRKGRVKVADFGLAKLVGTEGEPSAVGGVVAGSVALTEAGTVMGTPQYMAPEQRQHPMEVDHRADIYSLGVVFYQMLTGELPGKPIEPPSHTVRVDVRLDEVVLRALEKEPERRYQQASQLRAEVETISMDIGKSKVKSQKLESAPGVATCATPSSTADACGESLAREVQACDYPCRLMNSMARERLSFSATSTPSSSTAPTSDLPSRACHWSEVGWRCRPRSSCQASGSSSALNAGRLCSTSSSMTN